MGNPEEPREFPFEMPQSPETRGIPVQVVERAVEQELMARFRLLASRPSGSRAFQGAKVVHGRVAS